MTRFSSGLLMALCLVAASLSMQSCQKEDAPVSTQQISNQVSSNRGAPIYGVTVFSAGNPSQLVEMDANGNVLSNIPLFISNGAGQNIAIDDVKGVCWVNGALYVTTGFNAVDAYSFMLAEVKLATGELSKLSNSTIGPISDIDYEPASGLIYGLANNTNRLVSIQDNANSWGTYALIGNITNLGAGYTAKGLTVMTTPNGIRLLIAATTAAGGNAQLYSLTVAAGAANFLAVINPANQLATGHCGIGYDSGLGSILINRRVAAGFGLNSFAWNPPLANPTNSANWGGAGFNFEDLTTTL